LLISHGHNLQGSQSKLSYPIARGNSGPNSSALPARESGLPAKAEQKHLTQIPVSSHQALFLYKKIQRKYSQFFSEELFQKVELCLNLTEKP